MKGHYCLDVDCFNTRFLIDSLFNFDLVGVTGILCSNVSIINSQCLEAVYGIVEQ